MSGDVELRFRKKWTKIRFIPLISLFVIIVFISFLNNYYEINPLLESIITYCLFAYILIFGFLTAFFPAYPTEEERKFKEKKTCVLVVDSDLDSGHYKKKKFNRLLENFQVDHIAWDEIEDFVISDYRIIILNMEETVVTSWATPEKFQSIANSFRRMLESGGIVVAFAGYFRIKKRLQIGYGTQYEEYDVNISKIIDFIPTKTFSKKEGPNIVFNEEIDRDLQKFFFQEGKTFFHWSWVLDDGAYQSNCRVLARNNQSEVISGIFFQNKGPVILLPQSNYNGKIIKRITKNIPLLEDLVERSLEHESLDFSMETTPSWVDNYQILKQDILEKEIREIKGKLREVDNFKKLLYAEGRSLERIVLKALEFFGFQDIQSIKERADYIFDDEKTRYVSEIKSSTKKATERSLRQLIQWVKDEELKENSRNYLIKGVLIYNTERKKNPEKRGDSFHSNMIKTAEKYGWILISTLELLHLYELLVDKKLTEIEIRKLFSEKKGVLSLTKN